jgi:uncharacterized membrane protein
VNHIKELLEAEELHIKKLKDLVDASIQEEQLLSTKLIELEANLSLTWGQKLADKIAEFGGSWTFIIYFMSFFAIWIGLNIWFLKTSAFDPYPFILLNLILSCLAAIQAPVIMMSQNLQEDKDRKRARSDYLVNLKAEMEVRNLHRKVDLLMAEQMADLFKMQEAQLDILTKLEKKL